MDHDDDGGFGIDDDESRDTGRAPAAVYVSWITFKNVIVDGFAEGLPNVIDKTLFPGQAGGVQNQIMAALKFLALIEDNGKPTKALHQLTAPDEADRRAAMAAILQARYASIFAIDVSKATMGQLDGVMASAYNVNGDTRGKAIRFFLAAAKYAEIPLSRQLRDASPPPVKKKAGGTRRQQQTGPAPFVAPASEPQPAISAATAPKSGTSRTVELASGGMLTVSASLDMFMLSPADREFVFKMIDQLAEYELRSTKP